MGTIKNNDNIAQNINQSPVNGTDTQSQQAVSGQQSADSQAQQTEKATTDSDVQKPKKQRMRQIITSAIGLAILLWALVKIVGIFIDYTTNESSNASQIEHYISSVNIRASGCF